MAKTTLPASLELPSHMKHITSSLSLSDAPLSDLDCEEYRSRSSGTTELDLEECEAALQEVTCAPVQLKVIDLLSMDKDFDLLLPVPPESAERTDEGPVAKRFTFKDLVLSVLVWRKTSRWGRLSWPFALFLSIAVLVIVLARGHLLGILAWLDHLPWLERMVVFIALFTLVSFPFGFGYIILNLMAGYLYGFLCGQAVVVLSVAVGFSVAFLLCRSCLQDYAKRSITSPALLAVKRVVEGPHGLKVILLTRLTPVPFGLQNVLFSVSVRACVCVCVRACVRACREKRRELVTCLTDFIVQDTAL